MKNIGTLLMLLLFALTACTNEEEFPLPQPSGNGSGATTCRMMFYGDVAGYGGATRAGGHEWKEGDRLYIRFLGGSSTVTGCAVYSADGSWTLSYSGTLAEGTDQKCEVYYFENATHKSNTQVELTAHSAVYECTAGSYSYNGDDMGISALLSPKTGRVRFVSSSERSFRLSGISYYTSFDLGNKSFTPSSSALQLSIAQQGAEYSTRYVYGFYTDEGTCGIEIHTDTVRYSRKYPLAMLQVGMSGYITVPTNDNYGGWILDYVINGHEYVDLGLPSGIKWATCNVGATKPEEYGSYYAWGETEEKSNYSWSTYKWCNGSYNSITKYTTQSAVTLYPEDDVAHVKWGGGWRMPTYEELVELHDNCTWIWTKENGINGYKVTSYNGNSIFLPAAGYYLDGSEIVKVGVMGHYWSKLLSSEKCDANALCFHSNNHDFYRCNRNSGKPVRPVCD